MTNTNSIPDILSQLPPKWQGPAVVILSVAGAVVAVCRLIYAWKNGQSIPGALLFGTNKPNDPAPPKA